jgi:hypothetical protein
MSKAQYRTADATVSAAKLIPVTKANTDLPHGVTRGVNCGSAGTANLMDAHGNIVANFPLHAGYNPIQVLQVRTGGTATDIWALY